MVYFAVLIHIAWTLIFLVSFVYCNDSIRIVEAIQIEIPQPRYFSKISQSRIDDELDYARKHKRWTQRVILEIFHSQVIGKSVKRNEIRKFEGTDSVIGKYKHPQTGNHEYFRKDDKLNWDQMKYKGTMTICNDWEGVTCHEREDNGLEDTCWCITDWESDEYKWAEGSNSTNVECLIKCRGIGMIGKDQAPLDAITRIDLSNYGLVSSMPPEEISQLKFLERIQLANNRFIGSFPKLLGDLPALKHLDLSNNDILGFSNKMEPIRIEELILSNSNLTGTIPRIIFGSTKLKLLDLSSNELSGNIPSKLGTLSAMVELNLDDNLFTGSIPQDMFLLTSLKVLSLGRNQIAGSIPKEIAKLPCLEFLLLNNNHIEGKIPPVIFTSPLKKFDISHNEISGTIPKEIGASTNLEVFKVHDNIIQGRIDEAICKQLHPPTKYQSSHIPECTSLIACPRGYFHPSGHAMVTENCAPCTPCHSDDLKDKSCTYIGQTSCDGSRNVTRGDINGDGELSEREILRLLFILNDGYGWGEEFSSWGEPNTDVPCNLKGIDCRAGHVVVIDTKDAKMCSSQQKSCGVLPSEIGLLHRSLEVLDLGNKSKNRYQMRIPSEIGLLTNLKVLDLSNNSLTNLPSELDQNQELIFLNLFATDLTGTLADNVWNLKNLQKLDIRENYFSPQSISKITRVTNLQELLGSRCNFLGSIPSDIGKLTNMTNLELWGNFLTGSIPQSMESLKRLSRIDVYNNHLTGSIEPLAKLPNLEILHLKHNDLFGKIPLALGETAKKLSWLDLSSNVFVGEIPSNLGSLPHLVDIQLGDNKFFPPIPDSLCTSKTLNDGQKGNVCDHILCPMGTVSKLGFAKAGDGQCNACKEDETTLFLGQTECVIPTPGDHIELFLSAMHGLGWMFSDHDDIVFEGDEECEWKGVVCNEEDNVESIEFSLSKLNFDEDIFESHITP